MKPEVAIITDIHFDCRNGSRFFLEEFEKFFKNVFFPTLDERKIRHCWILGDLWEYRYKLGVQAMNAAFRIMFDELEARNIDVTIIYGNHDVAYKTTNRVNSIDFLGKMYPNVHVVEKAETIEFFGYPVNFVSWINDENMADCVEFIRSCPPTILCGHLEIKSFEMTRGHVCNDGFDKTEFDRFDMVLSGHFHTISCDGKIFYISNSFWTNWGDYDEHKGFRILNLETQEMDFIENPYQLYFKIWYDDNVDLDSFDFQKYRDRIVKVFVPNLISINRNKFNIFMEKIASITYSSETIETDALMMTEAQEAVSDFNEVSLDNREFVKTFIESTVTGDSTEGVVNLFFDILKEARQSETE